MSIIRKRSKFIRELGPMLAISFVILGLMIPMIYKVNKTTREIPEGYKPVTIVVKAGDRSWNIQRDLTPDVDVRKMLDYASKLNKDKSLGELKVGDELLFLEKEIID